MTRDAPVRMQLVARRLDLTGHHRSARLVAHAITRIFGTIPEPEADIAPDVRFDHNALGVVLHGRTRVGAGAQIQHHVKLGTDVHADSVELLDVGAGARIGAHAIVFGPVRIGARSRIGAGAVVLRDVPDGATALGNPARVLEPR